MTTTKWEETAPHITVSVAPGVENREAGVLARKVVDRGLVSTFSSSLTPSPSPSSSGEAISVSSWQGDPTFLSGTLGFMMESGRVVLAEEEWAEVARETEEEKHCVVFVDSSSCACDGVQFAVVRDDSIDDGDTAFRRSPPGGVAPRGTERSASSCRRLSCQRCLRLWPCRCRRGSSFVLSFSSKEEEEEPGGAATRPPLPQARGAESRQGACSHEQGGPGSGRALARALGRRARRGRGEARNVQQLLYVSFFPFVFSEALSFAFDSVGRSGFADSSKGRSEARAEEAKVSFPSPPEPLGARCRRHV